MDLLEIYKRILRRWWIAIPMALLGASFVGSVVNSAPPLFRATATLIVLAPPSIPETPEERQSVLAEDLTYENPYMRINDLGVVIDILAKTMNSDQGHLEMERLGIREEYTIAGNRSIYDGPIADVVVDAESEKVVLNDLEILTTEFERRLETMQKREKVDPTWYIVPRRLGTPTEAKRVYSSTIRLGIAAAALATVVVLALLLFIDTVVEKRRMKRLAKKARQTAQTAGEDGSWTEDGSQFDTSETHTDNGGVSSSDGSSDVQYAADTHIEAVDASGTDERSSRRSKRSNS
jgi:hypothetical protein